MTAPPSDAAQVAFLDNLQRLLAEGGFTASYKYALLLSLSDIAVERGDDTGAAMHVPTALIAEKFVRLYWRQSVPHPSGTEVLAQNRGAQATVVRWLAEVRNERGSLASFAKDLRAWQSLIRDVTDVVRDMPLLKLQKLRSTTLEFLYPNVEVTGGPDLLLGIELKPGVVFCLRRFHGLIEDLVRGAWVRYVRRLPANQVLAGEVTDLSEFMFGSERDGLSVFVPILRELQSDSCFYCSTRLDKQRPPCVDHFIPWSLYPVDLGHNFVLTHGRCNSDKSDALAALVHLERWTRRLAEHDTALTQAFDASKVVHDKAASLRVTSWAYTNAERAGAHLWRASRDFEPIMPGWRTLIA